MPHNNATPATALGRTLLSRKSFAAAARHFSVPIVDNDATRRRRAGTAMGESARIERAATHKAARRARVDYRVYEPVEK